MESEDRGQLMKGRTNADMAGQPQVTLNPGTFGAMRDKLLVAFWVFSYALILQVFRVLKSAEVRNATSDKRER